MNEREAARLIDYGQTRVAAHLNGAEVRGVAVAVELAPTMTIRHDDGTLVLLPIESCEVVRSE